MNPSVLAAQPDPLIEKPWLLGILGDRYPTSVLRLGTAEILEVTNGLESAGIPCCVVGMSGLKYYGAARIRDVSCHDSIVSSTAFPTVSNQGTRRGKFAFPMRNSKLLPCFSSLNLTIHNKCNIRSLERPNYTL